MTQPNSPNPNDTNNASVLNIDQLGREKNYDVNINISSAKNGFDHARDLIITIVIAIIFVGALVISASVLMSDKATTDDKKNAQSVLTGLIGLGSGYLAGKAQSKNP